ncbi:hypothetical protein HYE67_011227 [Fusarium culmorum]|uniref:Carbohydrate-binding module family 19 domain-containing protein n=4 Tax=Fusarium TaxID=5506 RepID=A0A2T4GI65_FUSCU|nr:hypothetical protein FPSE_09738 [Fusarium pseudograminearum CS3096]KAF0635193.1 hypothetical protein FPSE5266_09738 [Fusarium pseudograminearum]PTD03231.1 hypothetical protein FCULG_00009247 [Fusarium culmorum]EKJ70078.1 hypothetical protein FPSE_09738 [Fusarium pseudograminearum CS3096]QPC68996.1 hypothetical protein HYE67_011227 [Fusarium culmorum]QPC77867.1 hypothetical protein HYE68_008619 [Fusarium pseudograminearum]
MKLIPLVTMAAFAAATPAPKGCTPGTYSCTADLKGWQVCNVDRTWVFAGACPPKTACLFNKQNGSPYCVPPGFHF